MHVSKLELSFLPGLIGPNGAVCELCKWTDTYLNSAMDFRVRVFMFQRAAMEDNINLEPGQRPTRKGYLKIGYLPPVS